MRCMTFDGNVIVPSLRFFDILSDTNIVCFFKLISFNLNPTISAGRIKQQYRIQLASNIQGLWFFKQSLTFASVSGGRMLRSFFFPFLPRLLIPAVGFCVKQLWFRQKVEKDFKKPRQLSRVNAVLPQLYTLRQAHNTKILINW